MTVKTCRSMLSSNPEATHRLAQFVYTEEGMNDMRELFGDNDIDFSKNRTPGAKAMGLLSDKAPVRYSLAEGTVYVMDGTRLVGTYQDSSIYEHWVILGDTNNVENLTTFDFTNNNVPYGTGINTQPSTVPPLVQINSGPPPLEKVTKNPIQLTPPNAPPPLQKVATALESSDVRPTTFGHYGHSQGIVAVPKPVQNPGPTKATIPTVDRAVIRANVFLKKAGDAMEARAQVRDAGEGERSMAKTVNAFNALTGKQLTVSEGWEFMILLKLVRGRQGIFHDDDYIDIAAYGALLGEQESQDKPRG